MNENEVSIEDLVKIKAEATRNITFGAAGKTALELDALLALNNPQYDEIRTNVSRIRSERIFPNWIWPIVALFGLSLLVKYSMPHFWSGVGLCLALLGIYMRGVRIGFLEGYQDGFRDGNQSGVCKVFGVSPDSCNDISELATDMKIDEVMTRSFEKNSH